MVQSKVYFTTFIIVELFCNYYKLDLNYLAGY